MNNLQTDVPLINVPLVNADGRLNQIWFAFFIQLWRRTGSAQGSSTSDLRLTDIDIDADSISADLSTTLKLLGNINVMQQTAIEDASLCRLGQEVNSIDLASQTMLNDEHQINKLSRDVTEISAELQKLADENSDKARRSDLIAQSIQIAFILDNAQDIIDKFRRLLQDAIIDQITPIDPIRSMAYQDASSVKISGGSIDNTSIGATTQKTAAFTTVTLSGGISNSTSVIVINALSTNVSLPGTEAFSGILRFRDRTLGGLACFLVDPNGGIQTIGTNQITGLSVSFNSGLGYIIQASLSSGTVPRSLGWSIFGGT